MCFCCKEVPWYNFKFMACVVRKYHGICLYVPYILLKRPLNDGCCRMILVVLCMYLEE